MHFNVRTNQDGVENAVACINSQTIPNKGDILEIVNRDGTTQKYGVISIERKYINRINAVWDTFITVYVVLC